MMKKTLLFVPILALQLISCDKTGNDNPGSNAGTLNTISSISGLTDIILENDDVTSNISVVSLTPGSITVSVENLPAGVTTMITPASGSSLFLAQSSSFLQTRLCQVSMFLN